MKKKSVLIDESYHNDLTNISNDHGEKYGDLVEAMIIYFKKNNINPIKAINKPIRKPLELCENEIIKLMTTQEFKYLDSIKQELYKFIQHQKKENTTQNSSTTKTAKWVLETIARIDKIDNIRTNRVDVGLSKIEGILIKQQTALVVLAKLIDAKNKSGALNKIRVLLNLKTKKLI